MKNFFGDIHHFNTGCPYTKYGQPISWATFDVPENDGKPARKGIMFHDHARQITRAIPMPGTKGHTCYDGKDLPLVVHGQVDDDYVARCEKAGIHTDIPCWDFEWLFRQCVNAVGYM